MSEALSMMNTLTLVALVVIAGVMLVSDNAAEAKMGAKGLGREKSRCTGWSNSGQNNRGKYNRKKCRKPWDRKSSRDFDYDDDDSSNGGAEEGESIRHYYSFETSYTL